MRWWLWFLITIISGILAPPFVIWKCVSTGALTGRLDVLGFIALLMTGLLAAGAARRLNRFQDHGHPQTWIAMLVVGLFVQAVPPYLFGWMPDYAVAGLLLWTLLCGAFSAIILCPVIPVGRRTNSVIGAGMILIASLVFALNTVTGTGLTGEGRLSLKWVTRPAVSEQPAASSVVETRSPQGLTGAEGLASPEEAALVSPVVWGQYSEFASQNSSFAGKEILPEQPTEWWKSLKTVWTVPVGKGWSSVVLTESRVFTQEQLKEQDCVTCRSLETGALIWSVPHSADPYRSPYGGDGPRSTPAICSVQTESGGVRQAVIAVGPRETVLCLAAVTGEQIWGHDLSKLGMGDALPHGLSGSPLIVGDLVIVGCSRSQAPCLVALSLQSGEKVWEVGTDWKASYASPILADVCGVRQIVYHAGPGAIGVNPETGAVLWKYEWSNQHQTNASVPLLVDPGEGVLAITSGYGTGVALIKVVPDSANGWSVTTQWTSNDLRTKFSSCCLFGDQIVGLDDGILASLNLGTGQRLWKKGRYRFGQNLKIGNDLMVLTEEGDLVIVSPESKGPREQFRIPVLKGKCWSSPVFVNGELIIRNDEAMVRLTTSRD